MPMKFLLLLGGFWASLEGGWKCQFYFYGRGDFPIFIPLSEWRQGLSRTDHRLASLKTRQNARQETQAMHHAQHAILDGRNRALVIAEALARVIVAIRVAGVCWRLYKK